MKSKKVILGSVVLLSIVGAIAAFTSRDELSFEVQGVEPEASPYLTCHIEGGPLNRYRVCQIKPVTPEK